LNSAVIDISVALSSDMPVWPGSPGVAISRQQSIADGADANVTRLTLDVHCGTHVDAPDHFLNDGRLIDSVPLDRLLGTADVVDARSASRLDAEQLDALEVPADCQRLLLRTRHQAGWSRESSFDKEFTGLDESGAGWVADRGIALIGIDYLGIQAYSAGPETHRILLREGIAILEGIELAHVSSGRYELLCLPVLIAGAEAGPARAVLRTTEDS
jgi:arylformamidase